MLPRPARTTLMALALTCLLAAACSPDTEPEEVTIYGPYVGREADIFGEVLESFEEKTGIPTRYVGSNTFQSDLGELITTASLPDVVVLPQPSLLERLAEVEAVSGFDSEETQQIVEVIGDQWTRAVSSEGRLLAIPYRFVVKSLVWYRTDIFEERGYQIPTTLADLHSLTERIIGDGSTPWCAGMDDALATGWWATDWVEDLVIRRADFDTYNSWASLDTSFSDQVVVDAMTEFQQLIGREGAVDGGRSAVLNRSVEEAMDPFFDDQPGCLMHKQASFQPVWFPDGVSFDDERLDVFTLPGASDSPPPIMVSGELVAPTSDQPSAKQFLMYLLADQAFEPWHDIGGSLVARRAIQSDVGDNPLDRRLAQLINDAPLLVYDASDLMPRAIGTDAFFAGMIDLVAGLPAEQVAQDIQQAVTDQTDR